MSGARQVLGRCQRIGPDIDIDDCFAADAVVLYKIAYQDNYPW